MSSVPHPPAGAAQERSSGLAASSQGSLGVARDHRDVDRGRGDGRLGFGLRGVERRVATARPFRRGFSSGCSRPSVRGRSRSTHWARRVRSIDSIRDQDRGGTRRGDLAILCSRGPRRRRCDGRVSPPFRWHSYSVHRGAPTHKGAGRKEHSTHLDASQPPSLAPSCSSWRLRSWRECARARSRTLRRRLVTALAWFTTIYAALAVVLNLATQEVRPSARSSRRPRSSFSRSL